jgi:hypothetical protein
MRTPRRTPPRTPSGHARRVALALCAAAAAAWARPAAAQDETALRAAFEGKTIAVRIDMPATSRGVDVYPLDGMPVDFREVAQRLKDNGTALKIGQQVMVTKVVVKKNSHIEFQLGGGGYGTFGDWATSPTVTTPTSASETAEERELRERIKATGDKDERKRLERELGAMRSARERENARAANEAQQARAATDANMRVKRLESGSRFNLRFRQGIPGDALTPEGVMRALAAYVEFPGAPAAAAAVKPEAAAPTSGLSALKKGLSLADAESILGPAATASEAQEGAMTVAKRTYKRVPATPRSPPHHLPPPAGATASYGHPDTALPAPDTFSRMDTHRHSHSQDRKRFLSITSTAVTAVAADRGNCRTPLGARHSFGGTVRSAVLRVGQCALVSPRPPWRTSCPPWRRDCGPGTALPEPSPSTPRQPGSWGCPRNRPPSPRPARARDSTPSTGTRSSPSSSSPSRRTPSPRSGSGSWTSRAG